VIPVKRLHSIPVLALGITLWVSILGVAVAEPVVNLQTKYYHISGESVRELRRSMSEKRPKGQTHDALTTWNVTYSYSSRQVEGGVVIQNPKVSVAILTTLPHWNPPKDADPVLVERWRTFLRALQLHENGHAAIGTQAAREVETQLAAIPRQPNAEVLKQVVDTVSQQVIGAAREREKQFDLQTSHGQKQGARFP
jgi:predicted secreted Zn-dependent protease